MHYGLPGVYEEIKTIGSEQEFTNSSCKKFIFAIVNYCRIVMGINDRCAVGACNNARKYKEKYVIKPHISAFDKGLELRFWKCPDPKLYSKWTFACNRKHF